MLLLPAVVFAQIQLKSVKLLQGSDGPQVEIVTSAPVVPAIQQLAGPPRLVIDLPNTRIPGKPQRIPIHNGEIKTIRVDEHQDSPPIARVVVDMETSTPYTTESSGNQLLVHFPRTQSNKLGVADASEVKTTPPGSKSTDAPSAAGPVTFSGSPVPTGSSVTAGSDTAVLRLGRGGEVRICPGTTVSVTPSSNGHNMMLGMNTGALEIHYTLQSSSDSVLTPDFRIALAGPGQFDFAINADAHGNTCVRALPGNDASVIVSELMGNQTYQVRPSEQVMFHAGRINDMDAKVPLTCGCPVPIAPITTPEPESKPLPVSKPNDVHVTVDAPFVFSANAASALPRSAAPPAPTSLETENLPVKSNELMVPISDEVSPPPAPKPAAANPESKGFFGRVKKFLGTIFR